MRRMIAQGMSQNPGNQYKAVPVVKMPSPAFLSEWHLYDQLQLPIYYIHPWSQPDGYK